MLRALSTGDGRRYERLGDESGICLLPQKLKRTTSVAEKLKRTASVPITLCCPSRGRKSSPPELIPEELSRSKSTAKKDGHLSHPIFSFFENRRRKKKTFARPEVARYLQYLKEAGVWDARSNMPVIY